MKRSKKIEQKLERLIDAFETLLSEKDQPKIDWSSYCAFRWLKNSNNQSHIFPIADPHLIASQSLVGVEIQKQQLMQNTEQFMQGLPANNVLLWGSRGTGKSSLIRAMLYEYCDRGLKLIEIDREDLADLPWLLQEIATLDHKFILFCDDLSFEKEDAAYKSLKASLDGSLFAPAENVLIYATSNRRHLLPETIQDNLAVRMDEEGELHQGDAIEEKISLSERFGLWISFYAFNQQEYLQIVQRWLMHYQVEDWSEETQKAALQFALYRGSRSGRVAYQFARDWVGKQRCSQL